jgi:uncharacterized protein
LHTQALLVKAGVKSAKITYQRYMEMLRAYWRPESFKKMKGLKGLTPEWYAGLFKDKDPEAFRLFGMIHMDPIPGTAAPEKYQLFKRKDIIERAVQQAMLYKELGFDGIGIENMGDTPYIDGKNLPSQVSALTAIIAYEVKRRTGLPCFIQILAGANKEALSCAEIAGAELIRAEGVVFGHVADEGRMEGSADSLLGYRREIQSRVRIMTDMQKKHSAHATWTGLDYEQWVRALLSNGIPAGIITGLTTGDPANTGDVQETRAALETAWEEPDFAGMVICSGSGITPEQIEELKKAGCNMGIVGSYQKIQGPGSGMENWREMVSALKGEALVRARDQANHASKNDRTREDLARTQARIYGTEYVFTEDGKTMPLMKNFMQNHSLVIGTLHLDPLPGSVDYTGSPEQIIEKAIKEARELKNSGANSILLKDTNDRPYTVDQSETGNRHPAKTAIMAVIAHRIKTEIGIYCGIQILHNPVGSVSAAWAGGADFCISSGFVFAENTPTGMMDNVASRMLKHRNAIGAKEMLVFADMGDTGNSTAITGELNRIQSLAHAAEFMEPDAIIVPEGTMDVSRKSRIPYIVKSGDAANPDNHVLINPEGKGRTAETDSETIGDNLRLMHGEMSLSSGEELKSIVENRDEQPFKRRTAVRLLSERMKQQPDQKLIQYFTEVLLGDPDMSWTAFDYLDGEFLKQSLEELENPFQGDVPSDVRHVMLAGVFLKAWKDDPVQVERYTDILINLFSNIRIDIHSALSGEQGTLQLRILNILKPYSAQLTMPQISMLLNAENGFSIQSAKIIEELILDKTHQALRTGVRNLYRQSV